MKQAESFEELYRQIGTRKWAFFIVFGVIVTLTYAFLSLIDFVPVAPETDPEEIPAAITTDETAAVTETEPLPERIAETIPEPDPVPVAVDALPHTIIIDALEREVPVLNPTSRAIADLDNALLSGAVRHPDSADYSADGNVFILAHSSYLPNVLNRNFQAFNGLQDLEWGDTVRVQTDDTEYVYRVQDVYKARASEVFVPNTPGEARLTLATCNSFGSKDDRFIVEAVLVDTVNI